MNFSLLLLFFKTIPLVFSAQHELLTLDDVTGKKLASITIQGAERTQLAIIHRELLIAPGEVVEPSRVNQSLQRLKNLRVFHDVSASYFLDEHDQVHMNIAVSEVFTTIPILKITRGGGTTYLVAGAYDINVLGKYLETGAQYESWNGEDGGVIWFRNPRFMNERIRVGADLWSVKRPRDLYEPDGDSQGDFVWYQQKVNLFADMELVNEFTLGLGVEINDSELLDRNMSGQLAPGVSQALSDSESRRAVWSRVYLKWGQINYDDVLLNGRNTEFNLAYTTPDIGADYEAYRLGWDNKIFWRIGSGTNLAWRLRWEKTDSEELQDLYYIGGFENVRGYFDGQLRGKQYWQTSFEYREMVYRSNWLYAQANVFTDVAQLVDANSSIESNNSDIFYSAGIGLRLGSPKIYRFLVRLDVALVTSHPATSRFSFAVQQFF